MASGVTGAVHIATNSPIMLEWFQISPDAGPLREALEKLLRLFRRV
jgi:hypothetical protein